MLVLSFTGRIVKSCMCIPSIRFCMWGAQKLLTTYYIIVVQLLSCVRLLWPHGQQHIKLPCPSLSPGVCSSSCPLSQWCHPTICHLLLLPFFPALGSFPTSRLFTSGGQSIGASASAPVLTMYIHSCLPLELTGLISLPSKGYSRVFCSTTVQKHQFFGVSLLYHLPAEL